MKIEDSDNLLKNIELTGSVSIDPSKIIHINKALENVIDKSSGRARISPAKVSSFQLILSQPSLLSALSPFEIRCLSCHRVISYPSWHCQLNFDKNTFHYFVCFSPSSNGRAKLGICPINR